MQIPHRHSTQAHLPSALVAHLLHSRWPMRAAHQGLPILPPQPTRLLIRNRFCDRHRVRPTSMATPATANTDAELGGLSARGSVAIKPGLPYFKAFAALQDRPWSEEDPEGNIIVVVAENKLSSDLVHERLLRCSPPTQQALVYPKGWNGTDRLREALASLMERTWMKGIHVDPQHLMVLAGAGAVIENLFWSIGEQGECVLIPRPYYPAFDNDLNVKCGMVPVPFDLDESKGDIVQQLSDAAAAATSQHGSPVRAVLLTNPNNPLSTMYKRETLCQLLKWCMQREVHLVSDEIYALSVWGEGASPLVSLECIAREEAAQLPGGDARVRQLLHIVFGLSKDFCASGLRMGCLHTRNPMLLRALMNLAYFCYTSCHTQQLTAELLEDKVWVDGFLEENRRRMRDSYTLLSGALSEAGIPFLKGDSAMFCWIDLRKGLRRKPDGSGAEPDWEAEDELWSELAYKHGVLLTPGKTCHATEPGFFRMCWAWVPGKALPMAVRRIKAVLDARQAQH